MSTRRSAAACRPPDGAASLSRAAKMLVVVLLLLQLLQVGAAAAAAEQVSANLTGGWRNDHGVQVAVLEHSPARVAHHHGGGGSGSGGGVVKITAVVRGVPLRTGVGTLSSTGTIRLTFSNAPSTLYVGTVNAAHTCIMWSNNGVQWARDGSAGSPPASCPDRPRPPSPPAPSPKPHPLPPPGPQQPVFLHIMPGRAVDHNLFGWNLEQWASVLNLTFSDTAGLALTAALQPGVLRYPGGTNSNIWNTKTGRYVSPLPTATGYSRYNEFSEWISWQPEGTFSGAEFLKGLGGKANRVLWDLNVFSMNATEACDQIRYIGALPGQQRRGVYLEFGNELYLHSQGLPQFPNGSAYGAAMLPIVACARKLMPHAKLAACGNPGEWNDGLKPYLHLFDGLTLHDYSPGSKTVAALPEQQRISYVAGYSRARLQQVIARERTSLGGSALPMLMTEFNYGLDHSPNCMMGEDMIYGALHGAFHAARVVAAINEPAGVVDALTFETFVFSDPGDAGRPDCPFCKDDWCVVHLFVYILMTTET